MSNESFPYHFTAEPASDLIQGWLAEWHPWLDPPPFWLSLQLRWCCPLPKWGANNSFYAQFFSGPPPQIMVVSNVASWLSMTHEMNLAKRITFNDVRIGSWHSYARCYSHFKHCCTCIDIPTVINRWIRIYKKITFESHSYRKKISIHLNMLPKQFITAASERGWEQSPEEHFSVLERASYIP